MLLASEPWADDTTLYKPVEEQILINDNAAALAVQAYLNMCKLKAQVGKFKTKEQN